jgi:hypothetical protein
MTFWDKARQAAAAAAVTAKETAGVAGAGVRGAAGIARSSASAAVDRINPHTLADLIMKATAIQERTNAALREKKSAYRVAEVVITAAFPPQISFSIARLGDVDQKPNPEARPGSESATGPGQGCAPDADPGWGPAPASFPSPPAGFRSLPEAGTAEEAPTWPPPGGWDQATEGWNQATEGWNRATQGRDRATQG